jgi:hypothetical protein
LARLTEETARFANVLETEKIGNHISTIMKKIETSLASDSEDWKTLIPGQIILKKFCSEANLAYDLFRSYHS